MLSKEISVAVTVKDGKESAKWFEEKVGLESSVDDHWVLVWPKGSTAKIHLCEDEPDPGNTGIAFYYEDPFKAMDDMKARGVKFTRDVKKTQWGTSGMFSDPDGNEFWVKEGKGP
jgi:predicted enzyme related to lactoylglutathione lyase